jgi:hypothetical protein
MRIDIFFSVLGIKPRTLHMLGKHSITEPLLWDPQPRTENLNNEFVLMEVANDFNKNLFSGTIGKKSLSRGG